MDAAAGAPGQAAGAGLAGIAGNDRRGEAYPAQLPARPKSETGGVAGTMAAAGRGGTTGAAGNAGTTGSAGRGGTTGGVGATGSAGTNGAAGTTGAAGASGDPPGYVAALIGVGYGGIRIVSRDGGNTWGDRGFAANGGDDDDLLRAVAYGKGCGSPRDGSSGLRRRRHWTDHGMLKAGPLTTSIVEGLAYKDG